jgi:predicted RNA-binding Zn-ribbon protein involved in translation (DUF1610 family)
MTDKEYNEKLKELNIKNQEKFSVFLDKSIKYLNFIYKDEKIVTDENYILYSFRDYSCPDCGAVIKRKDNFCNNCGVKLNWRLKDA